MKYICEPFAIISELAGGGDKGPSCPGQPGQEETRGAFDEVLGSPR